MTEKELKNEEIVRKKWQHDAILYSHYAEFYTILSLNWQVLHHPVALESIGLLPHILPPSTTTKESKNFRGSCPEVSRLS